MKQIIRILLAYRLWTDPYLGYTLRGAMYRASALMGAAL